MVSKYIGVDVGGTTSTICVGDSVGNVQIISDQFPTRSVEGPQATVDDIATEIQRQLEQHGIAGDQVRRVTIATPGPATIDGVLLKTPNLVGEAWDRCPIREMLQKSLASSLPEIRVGYLGDGQAAALGEFAVRRGDVNLSQDLIDQYGLDVGKADDSLRSLFMVAVGTGFGGGEVRDRRVVRGLAGRAGHAGHLMLPRHAFRHDHDCKLRVGNALCTVESAVSLTSLTHQLAFRLKLDRWKDHPLNSVQGTDKDRAKRLRELAAEDDELAIELFDDQANALGIALLMIHYIGDYDLMVVGGGVCDLAEQNRTRYLDLAKRAYYNNALDGFRDFAAVQFSRCGDQASVIGAYFDAMGPQSGS